MCEGGGRRKRSAIIQLTRGVFEACILACNVFLKLYSVIFSLRYNIGYVRTYTHADILYVSFLQKKTCHSSMLSIIFFTANMHMKITLKCEFL
jgi:hypothetical protein